MSDSPGALADLLADSVGRGVLAVGAAALVTFGHAGPAPGAQPALQRARREKLAN